MRDDLAADRRRAVEVNASFPYRLATAADARGVRIIQIATDCVYSGAIGRYDESASHDATDVYGQTKSLGEVPGDHVLNLRCSIIGPEIGSTTSLLEWVLAHPQGATLGGYIDHHWNGVTTLAFARVASGIVLAGDPLAGTHHLVPADSVSKAELVRLIAQAWGRDDLDIRDVTHFAPDRSDARHPRPGAQPPTVAAGRVPRTSEHCRHGRRTGGGSRLTTQETRMTTKIKDSVVTITGGTGSFGSTMARHLLTQGVAEVRVFSRDESKQDAMRHAVGDARMRFHLGDVRDARSVARRDPGVGSRVPRRGAEAGALVRVLPDGGGRAPTSSAART